MGIDREALELKCRILDRGYVPTAYEHDGAWRARGYSRHAHADVAASGPTQAQALTALLEKIKARHPRADIPNSCCQGQ